MSTLSNELYTRLDSFAARGIYLPDYLVAEFVDHIKGKWYKNKRYAPLTITRWYREMYPEVYDTSSEEQTAGVQSPPTPTGPVSQDRVHACPDCGVIHDSYPQTEEPASTGNRHGDVLGHAGELLTEKPKAIGAGYSVFIDEHFPPE